MICGHQRKRITFAYYPNTKQKEQPMKPSPLTSEKLEQAARTLCKMRGQDPEETFWGGPSPVKAWKCAADTLRARHEELSVLMEVIR